MNDEQILDLLAEGNSPQDVAMAMIDEEVAAGNLSHDEVDLASHEYTGRVERVLAAAGG